MSIALVTRDCPDALRSDINRISNFFGRSVMYILPSLRTTLSTLVLWVAGCSIGRREASSIPRSSPKSEPPDRFRKDLGARGGVGFSAAIIRDRHAYPGNEFRGAGRYQSRAGRQGEHYRISPAQSSIRGIHWQSWNFGVVPQPPDGSACKTEWAALHGESVVYIFLGNCEVKTEILRINAKLKSEILAETRSCRAGRTNL